MLSRACTRVGVKFIRGQSHFKWYGKKASCDHVIAGGLLLAGTSVPMAQVGVRVAHKLPAKKLKYVFIAVMIYMGLKMIGVFGWLHLPI